VMMTTTAAMRMTAGRENFWIRFVIAFILSGFLCVCFPMCGFLRLRFLVSRLDSDFAENRGSNSLNGAVLSAIAYLGAITP
jgi:hypothetical protein